jgi:hypothetical protein
MWVEKNCFYHEDDPRCFENYCFQREAKPRGLKGIPVSFELHHVD